MLATSCVVIAAAARFHTQAPVGFVFTEDSVEVPPEQERRYIENHTGTLLGFERLTIGSPRRPR